MHRRLQGAKRGSFPLKGSNWFVRPTPGADAEVLWRADLTLLSTTHKTLRASVAALTEADLMRVPPGGTTTVLALLTGIAAHDVYHAGQIQLLKRLYTCQSLMP